MAIEIRDIPLDGDLRDFLEVVNRVYAGDPNYIRPLDMDISGRLSRKSPFFRHADGVAFAAYDNGLCVGRCSAQIDQAFNDRYGERTGFFGLFDTVDKQEVATALLNRAGEWLKEHGMTKMLGPFSMSTNEEIGCLVDGFDMPPMVLMPHHRRYQGGLIEGAGLTKAKDLFAWRYEVGPLPKRAQKGSDMTAALEEVTVRHLDKRKLAQEIELVMDIFNDAWSENWGYVPLTREELSKLAAEMKLILEPKLTYVAEVNGEAAAFAIALPNVNEHLRGIDGKLFPIGLAKILWGLKMKGTKTARLALLGVRKKYRNSKTYGGLSTYLYSKLAKTGETLGINWGELSWTLEDNAPVNLGIKMMGGKVYKTYRVYEREL